MASTPQQAMTPEEDREALLEVRRRLFDRWPETRHPLESEPSTITSPLTRSGSWAGTIPGRGAPITASPATPSPLVRGLEDVTPERPTRPAAWMPSSAAASAAAAAAAVTPSSDNDAVQDLWRRLVERPLPSCQRGGEDFQNSEDSADGGLQVESRTRRLSRVVAQESSPATAAVPNDGAQDSVDIPNVREPALLQQQLLDASQQTPSIHKGQINDTTTPETLQTKASTAEEPFSCELHLKATPHVEEFEQLNSLLRRHGFREVPHHLEPLPVLEQGSSALARIVTDGRSLWATCTQVLLAYEERGRRLQEALLAERSEDRQRRDGRIRDLLQEKSRLQEELRAVKEASQTRTSSMAAGLSPGSAGGSLASSPSRLTAGAAAEKRDRELGELSLRARAAEATARHREKELEKLKARLDEVLGEAAKRQEKEKAALSRPLRKRAAGNRAEEQLLEAAIAHRGRAEMLQAEVSSLSKQVHVLSFRLEEADEKVRQAEAHKARRAAATAPSSVCTEVRHAKALSPEELLRERELRTQAEETLRRQQESHSAEVRTLTASLRTAEDEVARLKAELRNVSRQPTASELRWQREALRLRDDLAEVRRAWKSVDSRGLMQRDKELRRLGLDSRALEETTSKADLVSVLLQLCRLLRVPDVAEIIPKVSTMLVSMTQKPVGLELLGQGVLAVLQELDAAVDISNPSQALERLQSMLASQRLQQCRSYEADAKSVWQQVANHLQLATGAQSDDCIKKLVELREDAICLNELTEKLCCQRKELPQRAASLMQQCDERMAAQRIVEALQNLLSVGTITEVLPALKDVLDVTALRLRRSDYVCRVGFAA
mmetsp:Transcript_35802/g.64973  ORF Transcript_35802/g.64973 Transcript_35802/m.64973 type:complete len:837 (+) Transcript_35802:71-2581(+)